MTPRKGRPPAGRGFVILISVLVTSAVGVVLAMTLVLLGIAASLSGFILTQSAQAKQLATGCADEALLRIKGDAAYTGSDTLSFGQGTCTFTVSDTGGENRLVTASGTVGETTRKAKITIDQITPKLNVTSWQEVADVP